MGDSGHRQLNRRSGLVIVALLALWIQALIPAGYMISPDQSAGLVICTGHGPLASHEHPGGAPTSNHDGACVFAGHGLAVSPPIPGHAPIHIIFVHTPAAVLAIAQSPGRGLAAPPPPSHAPPAVSI